MLDPATRRIKKLNILLVYLLILTIFLSFLFIKIFKKPKPLGEISPLIVEKIDVSLKDKNKWKSPFLYDINFSLKNPNNLFLAQNIIYEIEIENGLKKEGKIEKINPQEKKEIKEIISLNQKKEKLFFKIKEIHWSYAKSSRR